MWHFYGFIDSDTCFHGTKFFYLLTFKCYLHLILYWEPTISHLHKYLGNDVLRIEISEHTSILVVFQQMSLIIGFDYSKMLWDFLTRATPEHSELCPISKESVDKNQPKKICTLHSFLQRFILTLLKWNKSTEENIESICG